MTACVPWDIIYKECVKIGQGPVIGGDGMKTIVRKSTIPLYAVAVTWLLYALLFPLYRPLHFIVAAAAGAVVGLIARGLCKDIVEEVPEPEPEPETTGDEELDKMGLAEGLVRISVGAEDSRDLIADLQQALAAMDD